MASTRVPLLLLLLLLDAGGRSGGPLGAITSAAAAPFVTVAEAHAPGTTCPSLTRWYGANYTTSTLLRWAGREAPPDLCARRYVRSFVNIKEGLGSSALQKNYFLAVALADGLERVHGETVATHISDVREQHLLVERLFSFAHVELCREVSEPRSRTAAAAAVAAAAARSPQPAARSLSLRG